MDSQGLIEEVFFIPQARAGGGVTQSPQHAKIARHLLPEFKPRNGL